ncbi:MAG: pirin family protein [Rhodobacteraceae bacterium]|nr:pirin family protein [Paracoccaceae bacterium]
MSWLHGPDPIPGVSESIDPIETIVLPRTSDIGGFEVNRALPSVRRRMVGPFLFFDQLGPAEILVGGGIDIKPHPHIGLATVTYLFDGELYHRDSLGTSQAITPGALNWMSAGKGIVHSERETEERRAQPRDIFGIQSWVALPKDKEEGTATFQHLEDSAQPHLEEAGVSVKVIAGEIYGAKAQVKTESDLFYADVTLAPGARLPLDAGWEERALYILSGRLTISGQVHEGAQLLVFRPGDALVIENSGNEPARLMLLGGEPLSERRYIWWNFVSSSREKIEQAKEEWRRGQFDIVPGDEEDFIPLPE